MPVSPAVPRPAGEHAAGPSRRTHGADAAAPVRVLLTELNRDGTVGGSHQALVDVALNLDRSRFEPVVLFYQRNRFADRLEAAGLEVHCWDGRFEAEHAVYARGSRLAKLLGIGRAILHRWRFLRQARIGLLHMNNSPWIGYDDWLPAGRLAGIPCIANKMGAVTADDGRRWSLRRRLAASWDRVLPCSDAMSALARQDGCDPARVTTVHLGVHIADFRARVARPRAQVRASLGVGEDDILAVMVGNVREWKGQHVVVEALRRMAPPARARLHVAFAGAVREADADYLARARAALAGAGIEAHASFLGMRTDVPDLVSAADATIHASTHPEPFGIVIVEGMALGKVVFAADAGGPREILTDGSGVLHDPADPSQLAAGLERLVTDAAWRREMGQRAMRRAQAFDVPLMVRKVERAYRDVLGA